MSQTSSPISVCRADSGADFEVNMSNDTTVEHLKLRLAELTSIPVEHQILVCDDGTKLVQQKTLSEYGFPSKERRIFLYDKRQLLGDASMVSSQRDAANLIVAPLQVPSKPQFVPNKSESQQIRDLRQYVLEFSYHVEYAKSVVAAIEKRVKVIFQLQTEQKNQRLALRAAMRNLKQHLHKLTEISKGCSDYITAKHSEHEKTLQNFESCLQKLQEIVLEPSLADEKHKLLIHFIPVDKIRSWKQKCQFQEEQLMAKWTESMKEVQEINNLVSIEESKSVDEGIMSGIKTESLPSNFLDECIEIVNYITNDYNYVQSLLKQIQDKPKSSISNEEFARLSNMQKLHSNKLSELQQRLTKTEGILKVTLHSKMVTTSVLQERLKSISQLQSRMSTIQHKYFCKGGLKVMLQCQKVDMFQLQYIELLPNVYDLFIDEIRRRKAWMRLCLGEVERVRIHFTNVTAKEKDRRDTFQEKYKRYIPPPLLEKLPTHPPTTVHITLDPIDDDLPDVSESPQNLNVDIQPLNLFGHEDGSNRSQPPESQREGLPTSEPEKVKELEVTLEKKQQTIKLYEQRIKELEERLRDSQSQLEKVRSNETAPDYAELLLRAQNANKELKLQNENISRKLMETVESLKRKEEDLLKCEHQLKEKEKQLGQLQTSYEDVVAHLEQLQHTVTKLEQQRNEVAKQNEQLKFQLQERETKFQTETENRQRLYRDEIEKKEQNVEKLTSSLLSLETQRQDLLTQISQLTNALNTTQKERDAIEKQKQSLEEELQKVQSLLEKEKETTQSLNAKLTSVEKEKQSSQSELASLQQELKSVSQRCAQMEKDKDKEKKTFDDTKRELTAQIEKHRSDLKTLEQKLLAAEQKVSALETEKKTVELRNVALEKELRAVEEKLQMLQNTNKKLTEELAIKTKFINEQDVQIKKCQVDLSQSSEVNNKLTQEIKVAKSHYKELEEKCNRIEKELKSLSKENEDLKKSLSTNKQTETSLKEQIQTLKNKLQMVRESLGVIEIFLKEADVGMIKTNVSEEDYEQRLRFLRTQIEQLVRSNHETQQHAKVLEQLLQETKDKLRERDEILVSIRSTSISLTGFAVGHLVCFRLDSNGNYEIWNTKSPHYYLDPDCASIFRKEIDEKLAIVGIIVSIEDRIATASQNPYKLPLGTKYHTVIVQRIDL